MSGEVWHIDHHRVLAVRTDGVADDVWLSLCDASERDQDREATTLELPLATASNWVWWFASAEAGEWVWDARATTAVAAHIEAQGNLSDALRSTPDAQAVWPEWSPLPEALGIVRQLTAAQVRDTSRLLRLEGGANFSVPGAGKTTVAYTTFAGLRAADVVDRMLVLAPISAHESWLDEAHEVFEVGRRPVVAIRTTTYDADVIVFNYEALESAATFEHIAGWSRQGRTLLVADEAHRVKAGAAGVRGSAALRLSRLCRRRLVLTGTPRPNSSKDLENILEIAYPGRGVELASGSSIPTTHAFVRTTKDQLGLPDLVTKAENVPMSPAHDRVYQTIVDSASRAVIRDPALLSDVTRAGAIVMLLMQTTTDPTAVFNTEASLAVVNDLPDLNLEDLLRDLPASFTPTKLVRALQLVRDRAVLGEKVLIWACFRSHVDRLGTLLDSYNPAIVTGALPVDQPDAPTDRRRELTRFREDPTCKVLIATPHTLSEGVSLHHTTTHQIHVDRPYNAAMFLQSLDRTHRLGLPQDADCSATFLSAVRLDGSETIDHRVGARLSQKIAAMAAVLNDPNLGDLSFPSVEDHIPPQEVLFGSDPAQALRDLLQVA